MRLFALFAALLAFTTSLLRADLHEVTRVTSNGESQQWMYERHGSLSRVVDNRGIVHIVNEQGGSESLLDPERREYMTVEPRASWILSLAEWLRRPPKIRQSGVLVHRTFQLVDTGERRMLFGQVARHLQSTEQRIAPPGACQPSFHLERDGWYWDAGRARGAGRIVFSLAGGTVCEDTTVLVGEQPRLGYAVLETIRRDGRVAETRQVLEFSRGPLDPALFRVPAGYRRVDVLTGYPYSSRQSWVERMSGEWDALISSAESWFF